MTSPTQRTLALLKKQGYYPWIVEKYNGYSGRRTDLFYVIDILVLTPKNVIGIQSTGYGFSEHKKKLMVDEEFHSKHWLNTKGNELILIGWRKLKQKRGGKRLTYKPRIGMIELINGNLEFREIKNKWLRTRKRS